MSEYEIGDHIPVKVNGREYMTVIDEHGVQRFVANPIVAAFVHASGDAYNKWQQENPVATRDWSKAPFSLNDIDYRPGKTYTLDELIEFSTLHGYSVSGMCDLSFMEDVTVENPLWEENY